MPSRLRRLGALFALSATLSLPTTAHAIWPPTVDMTPDQLSDRANWPNDPGYGGQWEDWSWIPMETRLVRDFRTAELSLGSGNHIDRAWGVTIGDPRVLIAVLDSGINWDHTDIIRKVALNTAELPMPQGATSYDANGDGVVNIQDYDHDARVPCGTGPVMTRDVRMCRGADGMPNDPNRNALLDPGDLIAVFSDHTDADHNGYVDDIAGWDFFQDDNDPADATRFGHGSGEMRWSAAEANNGEGDAGDCPRCMLIPIRAADSFIGEVDDFAQGAVYAVDRGASVIQEALGTLDNSTFAMRALDYAWNHGVIVSASAADENSRHHNLPGTNNHALYVHAVRYDNENVRNSTTFLNFNNCTNYGAQLVLSVAGGGCSSEATGHTAGISGLLYSQALAQRLTPSLSAGEVWQLLQETTDDINVPESLPSSPNYDPSKYPSLPGWDQRFGYGRTNARRALDWLRSGKIPPEVDIVSPRWFTVFDPDRAEQRTLRIEGRIAARRATSFDYTIEWAPGVEPAADAWRMVRQERNVTAAVTDRLGEIDLSTVQIDNPGEVENRYTLSVRIRVVAHYEGATGDVPGEIRRAFYVHRDRSVMPGFPIDVNASGEASAHLADLNGDGQREIVYATADGFVHVVRGDGTALPGWPAHTDVLWGLSPTHGTSYASAAAYTGANRAIDPATVYDPVASAVAIADLDGDSRPEVVVSAYHGTIYVFRADGTAYGHGFPFALPDVTSEMTSPTAILQRGVFGSPVLFDLDADRRPEIIFGAFDGKLYALDGMTGRVKSGFPVDIHFPDPMAEHNRIFGSVGVGNFNGDATPDLVVVSNEKLPGDENSGAIYLVHGDGNNHAGGPYHPSWPLGFVSFNFFPLVGEGISSAPPIADIDGDGRDELAISGNALPTIIMARGAQPSDIRRRPEPAAVSSISILQTGRRGYNSNYTANLVSFAQVFSLGTFADLDGDGHPDYVTSGAELNLAINLSGGGRARPFSHLLGAWSARTGQPLPGFPRLLEDYTFFMNPSVADVGGDARPEVIIGTGGYYLRAFDACGREPEGWPKFTGQWIIPSPAIGDIDGDHRLDVVSGTRGGYLWAWNTPSDDRTANVQWEGFRHDNANTGNYGTALQQGTRGGSDAGAMQCPTDDPDDAGTATDASADATAVADAGTPATPPSGCGCRTTGDAPMQSGWAWMLAAAGAVMARRRRRA